MRGWRRCSSIGKRATVVCRVGSRDRAPAGVRPRRLARCASQLLCAARSSGPPRKLATLLRRYAQTVSASQTTKHALRACGRSPCAARRLPRAPQPAPPRLRLERVGASEKPALPALGKKGRRRGRRRAWEAPSSAGGGAARAARFVNLTRRDCLSVATKERSEFPRRALPPSSAGESGSRSEPDRRGRAPPPTPPALRCRLND